MDPGEALTWDDYCILTLQGEVCPVSYTHLDVYKRQPLNAGLTFRRSRVYTVEISGDEQKAREYLLSVLVDPISQECKMCIRDRSWMVPVRPLTV